MRPLTRAMVLALVACDDHPEQMVIVLDTDAPVASDANDDLLGPTSLFDRMRLDVIPPGATSPCDGCTNDFTVTRAMFVSGTVSFGVGLPAVSGAMVRARLYLGRLGPSVGATIDELVALPDTSEHPATAGLFLPMADVGVEHDPASSAPSEELRAPFDTSAVGTWAGATRNACDEASAANPRPAGAVCIPGGAYWMGSSDGTTIADRDGDWHRLAILSPFYLDQAEVTVARLRAAGLKPSDFAEHDPNCSFTTTKGAHEGFALNCVAWTIATAYCTAVHGQLPTASQYEYVATRFGRTRYLWGVDLPTCGVANWNRYDTALTPVDCQPASPALPAPLGLVTSPACPSPGCAGFLDAIDFGEGPIVDLAGNLRELTFDRPLRESADCLAAPIQQDPSCARQDTAIQVRGGSFINDPPLVLRGDAPAEFDSNASNHAVGFRCAYPADAVAP